MVTFDGLHFHPDLLDIRLNYGSFQCNNHQNRMAKPEKWNNFRHSYWNGKAAIHICLFVRSMWKSNGKTSGWISYESVHMWSRPTIIKYLHFNTLDVKGEIAVSCYIKCSLVNLRPGRNVHQSLRASASLSLLCHLAVKSKVNNVITFPNRLSVIEPHSERAQHAPWGKKRQRESTASVQMSQAHEFTPHAHTLFCQWHNRNNLYGHNETVRTVL